MKITVFSSNQARHLSLVRRLSTIADEVFYVSEVSTVLPGKVADFYQKSEVFQTYFNHVLESERTVFGDVGFLGGNVNVFTIKMKDLSLLPLSTLSPALDSDLYIVFGASWIRGDLIDFLIEKKAINIHMGTSPYYRGTACNFWAAYDGNPEYIGATIHYLSKGLDSGPMIANVFPEAQVEDKFLTGMRSVESAHLALAKLIEEKRLFELDSVKQDKIKEIRYSKNLEFNDEIALEFLEREYDPQKTFEKCQKRDLSLFFNPIVI